MDGGLRKKGLTTKQHEMYAFLLSCFHEEGYIPTLREIADHFDFRSVNAVNDHLEALERKGFIARRHGSSRGITLLKTAEEVGVACSEERGSAGGGSHLGVPIIGRVAAGKPISALENLEGYLELSSFYTPGQHFALHIRGDSMVEAGIWDGDFVIVREQSEVGNGEIGVAVIEGEATVKKIRVTGRRVELIPANDLYRPIIVDSRTTDFRIAGKVVGVHRVIR